jgi:flagellar biogenesis protein FliO
MSNPAGLALAIGIMVGLLLLLIFEIWALRRCRRQDEALSL